MNHIWTIGHSTRTSEEFIEMLQSFEIEVLADVRRFPGSKRYPHFNVPALKDALAESNINYMHFEELGGRRNPRPGSKNTAWRVKAFQGYADYMETPEFISAVTELDKIAMQKRTAYMCSEAVWWSCHRALISDYLKAKGWLVMHIMSTNKADEHPYTKPAIISDGKVRYGV